MPIVNYVREIERFIEYAADKKLTANERCLWYGLMHIFNQRANGNEWPGDFIPVSNDRVFTYCPGGFDTLARTRNRLKQLGLIDFRAGNRNKAVPEYKMVYQCPGGYPDFADKNTDYPPCYPQNTDNIRDNMRGNTGDNIRDNSGGNIRDIYPNINRDTYTVPKRFLDDEEEDVEDDSRARGREDESDLVPDRAERESEICGAYGRFVGRNPYPAELNKLVWVGHAMKMAPVMIARAIEIAAEEGARKPVAYVLKILDDWQSAHVLQPHQIDGYRWEEDIRLGKAPVFAGTGDATEDWKRREEAREARRKENVEAGLEPDWTAKEG